MLFLELQAELVKSWMQLAEAGTKSMTAAIQGAAEAAQPKPEPAFPFAALFTAANPFLAQNPFFAMAAAPQAGWPMTAFMTQTANPFLNPSWLPGVWNTMPWASMFGTSMFGAGLFGASLSGNPWGRAFGVENFWPRNAWSGTVWESNPWASLWQMPASNPQPPISLFADAWTASYRTATGQATTALLSPFQQSAPSTMNGWTWPMGGSGQVH